MVDVARHARHISLPDVGVEGQRRLAASSVLVVGAGGLGCPASLYLAAAGIGRIGLIDDDAVDLSNLQRQILHTTADVGAPKVASARAKLNALDPNVKVEVFRQRLNPNNAMEMLKGWDLVVDGTDNLPTRYLIDDACTLLDIPWVYGSVFRFEGQVSLFNHEGGPSYRDLFPEAPPAEAVPTCSEAGVLGVLPGIVGTLQATEAIKVLLGMPASLSGTLLLYDAQSMRFDRLNFEKNPDRPAVVDLSHAAAMLTDEAWCTDRPDQSTVPQEQKSPADTADGMFNHLSMDAFIQRRNDGWEPFILDVRSDDEYALVRVKSCDLQVPHTHIHGSMESIPKQRDIVIHCKSGMRSQLAAIELIKFGYAAERLHNLDGGIMAWMALAPEDIDQ
ncbi:MAG: molybdopterin-synthase adenylyltransferase MoeB [Candidatus Thermoplasmatota archaeon]|nr:molybdopterin-synthase adenylyltransferase MoeB [Candidatus Thermoplasmatota archaeon]